MRRASGVGSVAPRLASPKARSPRRRRYSRLNCFLILLLLFLLALALTCIVTHCTCNQSSTHATTTTQSLAKVFTFHKDETTLLADWLAYHSHIFGPENIVLIDHESADPSVLEILTAYADRGVSIVPFSGSFRDKAVALTAAMRACSNSAQLLIPIDVDEFIVDETGEGVLNVLRQLEHSAETRKFKFASRVATCESVHKRPALETSFLPKSATSMGKTFFRARDFVSTDQGNHYGFVRGDNQTNQDIQLMPKNFDRFFARTSLTLLHFAMRDFETWYKKLFQRATAYGFTMNTNCEAVRKGQRYCRSYQALRAGQKPIDRAKQEHRDVCAAIAKQQSRLVSRGDRQPVKERHVFNNLVDFLCTNGDCDT